MPETGAVAPTSAFTRSVGVDWLTLGEDFQVVQGEPVLQKYRRRRWSRAGEFAGWLVEAALPSLSLDQAIALYSASGSVHREEFQNTSIEEIRDSLDFLLFDTVKLEGRFQECAAEDGGFKLAGAGKEFVSYLLCVAQPTLLAVWNSNAERALRKLGINTTSLKQGPMGIAYIDLLEALTAVRRGMALPDFRWVDEFAYSLTRPASKGGR